MATTYKVKKGDTLSAIAKSLGTTIDQISGYKSGDPNKIFEGESLSVGGGASQNQAQERSSAISEAFGGSSTPTSTTATTEAPARTFLADSVYDKGSYTTKATEAKKKKEEVGSKLQNFEKTRYDDLYKELKLGDVKSKVDAKDQEIAEAKDQLNESLAKVRSNPGASAATITGEVSVIQDKLGNRINNLISERNSLAEDYNSGVGEIRDRIGSELADLEREYNIYAGEEAEANAFLEAYQQAVLNELQTEDERSFSTSQDDADFARQLQLAREKASGSGSGSGASGTSDDPFIQMLYDSKGGKPITDTQIQKLDKGLTVLGQLGALQTNIANTSTGPIAGAFRGANPWDTNAQTIKAQLNAIVPNLARGVYGEVGVLTDNDIKNYAKTLPTLTSTEAVRNAVLYITLDLISKNIRSTLSTNAAAGRDVSGFVDIYTEMEKTKNQILQTIPGAKIPAGTITGSTEGGNSFEVVQGGQVDTPEAPKGILGTVGGWLSNIFK